MLDPRLANLLACPRHRLPFTIQPGALVCPQGDRFAVVEGIPILLLSEAPQTHIEGTRSIAVAEQGQSAQLPQFQVGDGEVDPFVKNVIGATNGSLYQHLVGNLAEYPIPKLRLPPARGESFLEIGSNWGRWCIAAARLGYRPVGIDPSLKSIRAAKRVARQLGVDAAYVVADGRYLPFADGTFDQVFSYSVLQHLSPGDVQLTLAEIARVLASRANCLIQMPNRFGIRCLYHQLRRGFRQARDFEVRYWSPQKLVSTFDVELEKTQLSVDGFFSLNPQISDVRFFPAKYRALIHTSELLRRLSEMLPPLRYAADSLYVNATRRS